MYKTYQISKEALKDVKLKLLTREDILGLKEKIQKQNQTTKIGHKLGTIQKNKNTDKN